jgi:hypothetical protein
MNTGLYNTAVQVEMNYHECAPENLEEYGQKHGVAVILPGLRDRLALRVGQLLITMGQKLTESGTKNLHLSKDMA